MIGVEGVDAIVLGGDVEHVVRALSGDFDVGYVERLGVNRAVHLERAKLAEVLRAAKTTDTVVVNVGDAEKGFAQAAFVASAAYFSPYQAHAPFGPNCALADVGAESALVLSSTQDIYASRTMLATCS